MSSDSQVSVPRIMSGCVVSTNTSMFFPFLRTLWKLVTKILSDCLALPLEVLEILSEEAASWLPTELKLVSVVGWRNCG